MIRSPRWLYRAAPLLACVAGGVDVIAFMTLGRIFPANMTGNTVLLAINLSRGDAGPIERTLVALLAFCGGVLLGAWYLRGRRPGWHAHVNALFGLEWLVLAAIAVGIPVAGPRASDSLVTLMLGAAAAMAMGLQSAAVRHLRVSHLRTTFIAGPLVEMLSRRIDRAPRGAREPPRGTFTAIYGSYIGMALVAAFVSRVLPDVVMLLPLAALTALLVFRAWIRRRA